MVPKSWRREDVQKTAESQGFTRTIDADGQPMLMKRGDPPAADYVPAQKAKVIGPNLTAEELAKARLKKRPIAAKPAQVASARG